MDSFYPSPTYVPSQFASPHPSPYHSAPSTVPLLTDLTVPDNIMALHSPHPSSAARHDHRISSDFAHPPFWNEPRPQAHPTSHHVAHAADGPHRDVGGAYSHQGCQPSSYDAGARQHAPAATTSGSAGFLVNDGQHAYYGGASPNAFSRTNSADHLVGAGFGRDHHGSYRTIPGSTQTDSGSSLVHPSHSSVPRAQHHGSPTHHHPQQNHPYDSVQRARPHAQQQLPNLTMVFQDRSPTGWPQQSSNPPQQQQQAHPHQAESQRRTSASLSPRSHPYHYHRVSSHHARRKSGDATSDGGYNTETTTPSALEGTGVGGVLAASDSTDYILVYPEIRRKKVEMACHFCRARKLKCDGEHPTCQHCAKRNQTCTWDEVVRRRGPGQKTKAKEAASGGAVVSRGRRRASRTTASTDSNRPDGSSSSLSPVSASASAPVFQSQHPDGSGCARQYQSHFVRNQSAPGPSSSASPTPSDILGVGLGPSHSGHPHRPSYHRHVKSEDEHAYFAYDRSGGPSSPYVFPPEQAGLKPANGGWTHHAYSSSLAGAMMDPTTMTTMQGRDSTAAGGVIGWGDSSSSSSSPNAPASRASAAFADAELYGLAYGSGSGSGADDANTSAMGVPFLAEGFRHGHAAAGIASPGQYGDMSFDAQNATFGNPSVRTPYRDESFRRMRTRPDDSSPVTTYSPATPAGLPLSSSSSSYLPQHALAPASSESTLAESLMELAYGSPSEHAPTGPSS